jgi:hypothetical protein
MDSSTIPQDVNPDPGTSTATSLTPKVDLSSAPSFRKKNITNENELNSNEHIPPTTPVCVKELLYI